MILSIQFLPDGGAGFEYALLEDMKANGMQVSRQMLVPGDDPATVDQLESLFAVAKSVLRSMLEEHERADMVDSTAAETEDVDDEISPWDNPLERDLQPEGGGA